MKGMDWDRSAFNAKLRLVWAAGAKAVAEPARARREAAIFMVNVVKMDTS